METNILNIKLRWCTVQKMKFSVKDFFSKCDQIRRKLTKTSFFVQCLFYSMKLRCYHLYLQVMIRINFFVTFQVAKENNSSDLNDTKGILKFFSLLITD